MNGKRAGDQLPEEQIGIMMHHRTWMQPIEAPDY